MKLTQSLKSMTLAFLSAATLSGCGSGVPAVKAPATVPVSGVVTKNGSPLSDAKVIFIPTTEAQGSECAGITDAEGKFELAQIRGGNGAPPGAYRVAVSHYIGPGGKKIDRSPGAPPPTNQGGFESLPPRYSNFNRTELKADVPSEGGTFTFDLKGK
ncbi:carboxypeptidase regulatory-like domain-containing protein [Planctomicrobium sp. SH668]|uniref:carboxypeptidase regulatory-like domain-containing protein n=1 Tax=Planctomicrobium sp. SH668 TaxID=3448126 RepID=UPI003F5B21CD